jgi:uncharacterized protein (DUF1778 family)
MMNKTTGITPTIFNEEDWIAFLDRKEKPFVMSERMRKAMEKWQSLRATELNC